MTITLWMHAMVKFLSGILLVGAMIFVPAGTFSYQNGWLLMAVLFLPMFFIGILLMMKDPELLQKRLNAKEKQRDQSRIVKCSGLMFLAGFILAGLGVRFQWYLLPGKISIGAAVVFLMSYLLYMEVLRENTYLSRTIEIQEGQKVIDTGLYGIVRHPMYSATILMFLAMPLVLGSVYALIVFLFYPLAIVRRITGEERFLEEQLAGYKEYQKRVKYRLIPFLW